MSWHPLRTLQETETLLCAPGTVHETHVELVDGRLYNVYKNLWPSMREFWLAALSQYSQETYIVYEDRRMTYREVHDQALRVANLMRSTYGVQKGDRVGICSRNCPEYLVIFWACHLIGAVSVLANAWLPVDPLRHCLTYTGCKVIFLDSERAEVLTSTLPPASASSPSSPTLPSPFIVIDTIASSKRANVISLQTALEPHTPPLLNLDAIKIQIPISPEDDATVLFTSGTTGLPKGVLSTQRQFLTNVLNVLVGGFRAALRRGEDFPPSPAPSPSSHHQGLSTSTTLPQKAALVAVPLFHVTGSTSYSMMATLTGMKIVLMRKWVVDEAVKLIKRENVAVAGGVPSMVSDLVESPLTGHPLEGLLFGGAPAPDSLVPRARKAFPSATMIQGYGLTETNSIAVSASGEDYLVRPKSTGRASPVNEIRIVQDGKEVERGQVGEVWLRGPNIMKGYWGDPEATRKILTADGWLRSGDLGYLDLEGFLYIKDRIKDIIIRGGENIDSVSVENALYHDPRVHEAAAVGVPDERLGELVTAVVSIKPAYRSSVTESTLMVGVRSRLPRFAVPVMIVVHNEPFKLTPSGKIIKNELRELAKQHWQAWPTRKKVDSATLRLRWMDAVDICARGKGFMHVDCYHLLHIHSKLGVSIQAWVKQ